MSVKVKRQRQTDRQTERLRDREREREREVIMANIGLKNKFTRGHTCFISVQHLLYFKASMTWRTSSPSARGFCEPSSFTTSDDELPYKLEDKRAYSYA